MRLLRIGPPPPPGAKAVKCAHREVPQFTDIAEKSGIRFNHVAASDNRYVVESMSGGVLLMDYDRDGYPDIYFTNAPTVDMARKGVGVGSVGTQAFIVLSRGATRTIPSACKSRRQPPRSWKDTCPRAGTSCTASGSCRGSE